MLAAAFLGTVAAASVGTPGASTQVRPSDASRSAALPLTITTRVDARGNGAFTLRGALVDSGRAAARRAVVNGRLVATITLVGANGGLVLTSRQPCGRGAGRWGIVSGTRTYAGVAGHGATSVARCRRPLGPAAVVFRGSVEVPPARLAPPGPYGGQTTQDASFLFEVTPDGRTVANVLLGQFRYECIRSDGLHIRGESGVDTTFPGPFPIADDGTFSFATRAMTVAGRFTSSGAEGAVSMDIVYPADAQGRTQTCKGSVSWTAKTPPPPPKRPLAGTYCGFVLGCGDVCVEVTADGRQVRGVRAAINLTCGLVAKIPVTVNIASDLVMPLRTDLSFRGSFPQQFEGMTIQAAISGTFDQNGGLTGVVGPGQLTITRDGGAQVCRGNGNFTAKLQR